MKDEVVGLNHSVQSQPLPYSFTISTELACESSKLWSAIVRMAQVNFELSPFLRMSVPRDARDKSIEHAPLDHLAFMSVILLFGIIPIDLHFVHLTEVEPGHRFVETSYTLVNATWRHERTIYVLPSGKGCQITDNIGIRPRLPFAGVFVKPLARALFAHRHRKLLAQFGPAR